MQVEACARRLAALGLLLAVMGSGRPARAQSAADDPWIAPDKGLHFSAGFGVAAVGYGAGLEAFDSPWAGVGLGLGAGVGLNALKEGLDAAGLGNPSWRDFSWGAGGSALAVGLNLVFAVAFDNR